MENIYGMIENSIDTVFVKFFFFFFSQNSEKHSHYLTKMEMERYQVKSWEPS